MKRHVSVGLQGGIGKVGPPRCGVPSVSVAVFVEQNAKIGVDK